MCIPISNSPACGTAFSSKTLQVAQKWFWELFSLQNDQSHLEGKLLMNMDDNSGPKRVSELKTRFGALFSLLDLKVVRVAGAT